MDLPRKKQQSKVQISYFWHIKTQLFIYVQVATVLAGVTHVLAGKGGGGKCSDHRTMTHHHVGSIKFTKHLPELVVLDWTSLWRNNNQSWAPIASSRFYWTSVAGNNNYLKVCRLCTNSKDLLFSGLGIQKSDHERIALVALSSF